MKLAIIAVGRDVDPRKIPTDSHVIKIPETELISNIIRAGLAFDYTVVIRSTENLFRADIKRAAESLEKSLLNVATATLVKIPEDYSVSERLKPYSSPICDEAIVMFDNRKIRVTNLFDFEPEQSYSNFLGQMINLGFRNLVVPIPILDSLKLSKYPNDRLALNLSKARSKLRLLVDARGLQDHSNGTSKFIVQYLKSLSEIWNVDAQILVSRPAFIFHGLSQFDLKFRFTLGKRDRFDHGILLNQPFDKGQIEFLDKYCLTLSCVIYDIISVDLKKGNFVSYDKNFELAGLVFDHLFFISESSKEIYTERYFTLAQNSVIPLSMVPSDYRFQELDIDTKKSNKVLVAGNDLPHKNVLHTVKRIKQALPHISIETFTNQKNGGGDL